MARKAFKALTMDERKRLNWIQELRESAVYEGPNGEPLQSLSTHELRGLVIKEHMKRD